MSIRLTCLRSTAEAVSSIRNWVCPECGGKTGGRELEFKCRGRCETDWRELCHSVRRPGFSCTYYVLICDLKVRAESCRFTPPKVSCLMSSRAWRKCLEHFRYAFVEVLFIVRCLIGQHVFGATSPNQLLTFRVVHVDDQSSYLVVLLGCCCVAEASESAPSPAAAKAIVKGVQSSLRLGRFYRHDGNVSALLGRSPALRRQLVVHGIFYA